MTKLRIFLAEDHVMVRTGLKSLINAETDMEVIGEATDGQTALKKSIDLKPDVVVMDISLPQLSGTQATQQLKVACPNIRVVALTVHEDKSYLRELLEAGASGYVLKRAAAEDLIRAIRLVAKTDLALRSNPPTKRFVLEKLILDLTAEAKPEIPGWSQEELPV